MTTEFALSFAKGWVAAWNAHDLEMVLAHYSEDVTIESPMAQKLYPQSGGTITGKSGLRKYWKTGLEKSPHLKFELMNVFAGVHSITLSLFNTASCKRSTETMSFDRTGKVFKAIVCFSGDILE